MVAVQSKYHMAKTAGGIGVFQVVVHFLRRCAVKRQVVTIPVTCSPARMLRADAQMHAGRAEHDGFGALITHLIGFQQTYPVVDGWFMGVEASSSTILYIAKGSTTRLIVLTPISISVALPMRIRLYLTYSFFMLAIHQNWK